MRGRPPKPIEVRLAEGDLRKIGRNKLRAMQLELPPRGDIGISRTPPRYLPSAGKLLWRRLVRDLEKMQISDRAYTLMFEMLCASYAVALEAEDYIEKNGVILKEPIIAKGDHGLEVVRYRDKVNPACMIARNARSQVMRLAAQFGLSPVDRMRLRVDKPSLGFSSLAEILALKPPPRPVPYNH